MVYDRTHTRDLNELESMHLSKALPFAAVTFVIAAIASMGMPGFSGFAAEFQVILGAWKAFPTLAILTGVGILIGIAYTLRAMQKAFYGDAAVEPADHPHEPMPPISFPEKLGALLLIAVSLLFGLFPRLLLDIIVPSFNSPLFDWMRRTP